MKRISDILKEERETKGYSHQDIEKAIKIKVEFIKAIEEGNFDTLPSETYAFGFVKNYADFLGLPKNKIGILLRREFGEEKHDILPNFRKEPYKLKANSFLTSKNIFIVSIFLVIIGFIFFQYSSLFFGPPLKILNPKEREVIQNNVVNILGKTEPYSAVFIDEEQVSVGIDGVFKKSTYVFPGNKEITVSAKSRFGKETKTSVNVIVK